MEAIATSNKKLLGWRPFWQQEATRLEAIATRVETITTSNRKRLGWRPLLLATYRLEAIATRMETITTSNRKLLANHDLH